MAAKTTPKKAAAPKGAAPASAAEVPVVPVAGVDDAGSQEPPALAEPVTYRVVSPLRHNGERYKVGALIELGAADADRLLALRVVADEPAEG